MIMGIVEKLKRLHKQTLLKLNNIKRVAIADEAGVNNEEYLSRARTLDSYTNPKKNEEDESAQENEVQAVSQKSSKASSKKTKECELPTN